MGNNWTTNTEKYNFYGLLIPTNIEVSWLGVDLLHVQWSDIYNIDVFIEVWASINSAKPVLLATAPRGATSLDITTLDTEDYEIFIRTATDGAVSEFSRPYHIGTLQYYFIDPAGVDDAGRDGSNLAPWLTLAYACTRVTTPGEIIHVNAGTYVEAGQITIAPGVSIVGAGVTSIIKLNYVSTGILDAAIMLSSPAGVPINGNQSISNLVIDGDTLTCTRGIYIGFRNNVVINDCTIQDINYNGVIFNGTALSWSIEPTNYATGNKVYNCILDNISGHTGVPVGVEGGVRILGQSGFEFYNNTSTQNSRVSGENGDNIKGYANRALKVYNNTFNRLDVEAWWNFYSEFHYSWGGVEIYDNHFIGGGSWDASGNVKGIYDYGLKMYNNHFTTTTGLAVARGFDRQTSIAIESFTYSNDIYIFNNTFVAVDIPIILGNSVLGVNNVHIYYNLMLECENLTDAYSNGIILESSYGVDPIVISDVFIYNNVITGGASAFAGVSMVVNGNINNVAIRNNIIQGPDFNFPVRLNAPGGAGVMNNLLISHNIFNGCVSNAVSIDGTVTVNSYTNNNDLNDDPLFIGGGDYHLQAGSPAINSGINVGLLTDLDAVTVSDPPERGAYEYV